MLSVFLNVDQIPRVSHILPVLKGKVILLLQIVLILKVFIAFICVTEKFHKSKFFFLEPNRLNSVCYTQ